MAEIKKRFHCEIKDISLVSVNERHIIAMNKKTGGKFIKNSTEYNRLIKDLFTVFRFAHKCETLKGKVLVEIVVSTYKDIDNVIKPVIDSLQKAEVIEDDRNVSKLYIVKNEIKKGSPDSIIVKVYQ
jgi:Holliday junction resolvase RusA-like endonuclease